MPTQTPVNLQPLAIAGEVPESLKPQADYSEPDWKTLSVTAIAAENRSVAERVENLEAENHNLRVALKEAEEAAMDRTMKAKEGIDLGELAAAATSPMDPALAKFTNEAIAKVMGAPLQLSPEDAEKLKAIAAQHNPTTLLPDGSRRVSITVSEEICAVLSEWAIGAGEPFDLYLPTFLENSLYATVMGANVG